ncbi:hypothetical protein PFISCL1PPCAC_16116 [Pristionchus fissidentatus]|uniref:G protein-coupled receptor n=1 Tax=Pristionchus fissidentatus TaxID=1538716 RepID=A0AAV5W4K2_9BILA|nr:hypothetical protein PFISCL1PPCAC_16116 [Pristionchus fissidentatus]
MFYNCNVNRSNSECRSLAIFGTLRNVETGFSTFIFIAMCAIEFVMLVAATVVVTVIMRVFWNCRTYHVNMMTIYKFFCAHMYIYTIGSTFILAYQTEILSVTGNPSHPFDIIILVVSIFRYYQLFSCVFMLSSFLCERIAATLFIDNYECNKRTHIPCGLLIIVVACSALISINVTL